MVGGADEQHIAEVNRHIYIVIHELVVLAEVQDVQDGTGDVTLVSARLPHFVYLVQNDEWVVAFGSDQG